MGLSFTGTIGVLIKAKEREIIHSVKVSLYKLKEKGFYMSDEIVNEALRISGEKKGIDM